MFSHHIIAYPLWQRKLEIVYNLTHSAEKPYFLKLYAIKYRRRNPLYFPGVFCLSVSDICSQYAAVQHYFLCLFFHTARFGFHLFPVAPLPIISGLAYTAFAFKTCFFPVSCWIDIPNSPWYILFSSVVLTPKVICPEGKDEKNLIREYLSYSGSPVCSFRVHTGDLSFTQTVGQDPCLSDFFQEELSYE